LLEPLMRLGNFVQGQHRINDRPELPLLNQGMITWSNRSVRVNCWHG